MTDPVTWTRVTISEFNRIIDSQKPPGLREIADAWNSGTWRDDIRPTEYTYGLN
jgi:hypothetical protein